MKRALDCSLKSWCSVAVLQRLQIVARRAQSTPTHTHHLFELACSDIAVKHGLLNGLPYLFRAIRTYFKLHQWRLRESDGHDALSKGVFNFLALFCSHDSERTQHSTELHQGETKTVQGPSKGVSSGYLDLRLAAYCTCKTTHNSKCLR